MLLLHSTANDLHSYTVLLRTPSEVGTHGFNIQDSSSLVDQDRHYIREAIAQITRAVDLGIARAFGQSGKAGGQAPSQPADTIRDLRPALPPQDATVPEDLPTLISEVGEVMFRLIAPDRMRQYLSTNPCSLTITTNDLELPWELMYDESLEESASEAGLGFLCLQRPIARMPMGRAFPRLRPVTQHKAKLRFLLIYADPDQNLAAAEREIDKIKSALDPGSRNSDDDIEVTTLRRAEVTGDKLNKALLTGRYDVIHFAGHAHFSEEDPDLSGLLLHERERFLSQKIERFVEGQPLVFPQRLPDRPDCQRGRAAARRRVLLETCRGPRLGIPLRRGARVRRIAVAGVRRPRGGVRSRVLQPGSGGADARRSHATGTGTTREKHPDSITWASFVLYGDPTYRLVR